MESEPSRGDATLPPQWFGRYGGGALAALLGVVQAEPGERKRKRRRRRKRRRQREAGPALYPDLRTLVPADLRFDELDGGTHVLRFTNTVWNAGEGRLELQAPTAAQGDGGEELYQNLYDAPIGGKRVGRRRVNGTIVYHDSHAHYHFADFASYQLLERDDAGDYQQIGHSAKTSFCITDNFLFAGDLPRQYSSCNQERQGLTPGWRDTYRWDFDEQWVELENGPLPGGEYGLRSIADPSGLLDEGGGGREEDNAATAYFTVAEDGTIQNVRDTPDPP